MSPSRRVLSTASWDYLFYSPRIKRVEARVRQDDTLRISNHLPVIARFLLPTSP
jgi:endonuclease/exonuclease/phosphatase (EEP) superfamily protein YafD